MYNLKLMMLHKNATHGRTDDFQYVAHHFKSFITETAWYDDTSCMCFSPQYEAKG